MTCPITFGALNLGNCLKRATIPKWLIRCRCTVNSLKNHMYGFFSNLIRWNTESTQQKKRSCPNTDGLCCNKMEVSR